MYLPIPLLIETKKPTDWVVSSVLERMWVGTIFNAWRAGLRFHTWRADSISIAQDAELMVPTAITPILVFVAEIISEMRMGAMSLHIRSIRRIAEFRCVRSLGIPSGAAATTTQSRSMEIIFPDALRFSPIPRRRMVAKRKCLRSVMLRVGNEGIGMEEEGEGLGEGWTMKNQIVQQVMTVNLLRVMELMSVLRRSGERSTQRPTVEEKHIDASVLTMPLFIYQ